MGCQPQERLRIIRPNLLPQMLDDRFVTAHLHILPGKAERQPHQRIEPVQAQGAIAQQLPHMVAPADMVLLVGNDEPALVHRGAGGQVDPGPEYPQDEGGSNAVGKIDFPLQRRSLRQSAAQDPILDHAEKRHDGCSAQPDIHGGEQERRLLFRQLLRANDFLQV